MAKEGVFEKNSKGFFELTQAVPAYITAIQNDDELRQEKILHERAKRKKAELELGKLGNRLHDAADVEFCLTGMLVTFRNRILGVPHKKDHAFLRKAPTRDETGTYRNRFNLPSKSGKLCSVGRYTTIWEM